jgi:prepilin-type N-terminal cleavage/methylation domain-containing protein
MRATRTSGFTILEVLVALAILLFGMTSILGLLTYGTALSKTAQLKTSAASAAQAVIADLEESMFPEVDGQAGEPRAIVERAVRGVEGLVYSAEARPNPDRTDEYRVDVAMSWSAQGVRREKRFTTLLYREIPFGERLRRRATPGVGAHLEPVKKDAGPAAPSESPR